PGNDIARLKKVRREQLRREKERLCEEEQHREQEEREHQNEGMKRKRGVGDGGDSGDECEDDLRPCNKRKARDHK
ncbi:hypothetical protein C0992_003405, partial [Termitomyces sp. T32_za158]